MIEGLKIRVLSQELQSHCRDRAEYHNKRANEKEAQLPAIKDAADRIKATQPAEVVAQMSKGGVRYHADVDDTIEGLEKDIRDHRNKALSFLYLADHFFDEAYSLAEADLIRLEILARNL